MLGLRHPTCTAQHAASTCNPSARDTIRSTQHSPARIQRPPYASLYADQASGSSMFSLKATYRQAGFDLSADAHEAPDYLGIELAFCAVLLDRVAQACESGEDEAAVAALVGGADDFVAKRVLPLGCGYADEAIPYAKTGYCRGMLHLLKEFLETEEMLMKGEEAVVSAA